MNVANYTYQQQPILIFDTHIYIQRSDFRIVIAKSYLNQSYFHHFRVDPSDTTAQPIPQASQTPPIPQASQPPPQDFLGFHDIQDQTANGKSLKELLNDVVLSFPHPETKSRKQLSFPVYFDSLFDPSKFYNICNFDGKDRLKTCPVIPGYMKNTMGNEDVAREKADAAKTPEEKAKYLKWIEANSPYLVEYRVSPSKILS